MNFGVCLYEIYAAYYAIATLVCEAWLAWLILKAVASFAFFNFQEAYSTFDRRRTIMLSSQMF